MNLCGSLHITGKSLGNERFSVNSCFFIILLLLLHFLPFVIICYLLLNVPSIVIWFHLVIIGLPWKWKGRVGGKSAQADEGEEEDLDNAELELEQQLVGQVNQDRGYHLACHGLLWLLVLLQTLLSHLEIFYNFFYNILVDGSTSQFLSSRFCSFGPLTLHNKFGAKFSSLRLLVH